MKSLMKRLANWFGPIALFVLILAVSFFALGSGIRLLSDVDTSQQDRFEFALLFLVVASAVLYFPFSYMAYHQFQRPVRIKRLRSDFELLTAQWDETVYQQSENLFNYALHIALAMLITLVGLFILFMPLSDVMDLSISDIGLTPDVLRAMALGFLGSFLFSAHYVYRRFTTSDLLPSVYLYCFITIALGIIFNYVLFRTIEEMSGNLKELPGGLEAGAMDLLAFAIGLFPIMAVQWLTRTAYKAFGQPQRRSDLLPLDQLDGIDAPQEIRLRDFGISDAQNLASTEIPLLLINTPFPVQTVVDWVDQAILMVLLNDMNALDSFRKAHIRTMTDFRDFWAPIYEKRCALERERDSAYSDEAREAKVRQLSELAEKQTNAANMFNSNVVLLDALYTSSNFDMNIHYLSNYRRNVKLLLPNWESARFNRYLIEAYMTAKDSRIEQKELARLWTFVNSYLESNQQIKNTPPKVRDSGRLGSMVDAASVEARLGLARLYLHRIQEDTENRENLADARKQIDDTCEQIVNANQEIVRLRELLDRINPGHSNAGSAPSTGSSPNPINLMTPQISVISATPPPQNVDEPGSKQNGGENRDANGAPLRGQDLTVQIRAGRDGGSPAVRVTTKRSRMSRRQTKGRIPGISIIIGWHRRIIVSKKTGMDLVSTKAQNHLSFAVTIGQKGDQGCHHNTSSTKMSPFQTIWKSVPGRRSARRGELRILAPTPGLGFGCHTSKIGR